MLYDNLIAWGRLAVSSMSTSNQILTIKGPAPKLCLENSPFSATDLPGD